MSRVRFLLPALVILAALAIAVLQPWRVSAGAQPDRSLYVNVTEVRYGWTENLPDGGTCSFVGQQFGYLSSVPMHVVVENEEHHVIAVQEVAGTIRHTEGDEYYRCDATFNMPLPEAAFYTIRLGDVYYTTVAEDRLATTSVIIVLESGESWRPPA